jgi:chromosome partitioning protein
VVLYTIVAASQKGGSGKTTLSGHLGVEACRAGAGAVALIDTDPQGSLAHWWNARGAPAPHFVKVGTLDLKQALAQLDRSGFQIAIIDTPPAITHSISQVVAHADLVIVPTRPSPHDLRAVGATVDIAERHNKPLVFVINAATARARITGESAVALSQHGTVAPITIHHRVDFAASMIDGRTVGEILPNSASAREISDLWYYLQGKLSRVVQDPSLLPAIAPEHLSVRPLLAEDEDQEGLLGDLDLPPPIPKLHGVPERRAGAERRVADLGPPAGIGQRRVHVFGRRRSDLYLGGGGK